jgi:hypothetical protein
VYHFSTYAMSDLYVCDCMPGLGWSTENPGECSGKPDRAAWDRSVGFEMNASGFARPHSSCVLNADGKPVLPTSKPQAFRKWPCKHHGRSLFESIKDYPCAAPLSRTEKERRELSGDAQLARVRERIVNRDKALPSPVHGPGASAAGVTHMQSMGDNSKRRATQLARDTLLFVNLKEKLMEDASVKRAVTKLCEDKLYEMQEYLMQYVQFLAVKCLDYDTESDLYSPCDDVDEVWHEHILDTKAYSALCDKIAGEYGSSFGW